MMGAFWWPVKDPYKTFTIQVAVLHYRINLKPLWWDLFANWLKILRLTYSEDILYKLSPTEDVHAMRKIYPMILNLFQIIKDYQLMAIVCALVGFDVLLLAVWEFIDPLEVVAYNKTHQQQVLKNY